MKTRVARTILLFAVLALSRPAVPAPISYYFSGTISSALGTGAPLLGATFTGRLDDDPDWFVTDVFANGAAASVPASAFELNVPGSPSRCAPLPLSGRAAGELRII